MSDGKGIVSKGPLTDKIIDKMQNYGMAIRQLTSLHKTMIKKNPYIA